MVDALSCHALFDGCRVSLRREGKRNSDTQDNRAGKLSLSKEINPRQRANNVRYESFLLYCKIYAEEYVSKRQSIHYYLYIELDNLLYMM